MGVFNRLKHAWNVFMDKNSNDEYVSNRGFTYMGYGSFLNPYRPHFSTAKDRTMINSIYNRIAVDCSLIDIKHVKVDKDDKYIETMDTDLNTCLTIESNKDQTSKSFIQDLVMSMLDEGYVAVVPVDTTFNLKNPSAYDIKSMRTGKIIEWFPDHVKIDLYNDRTGQHQTVMMPKSQVAIIENPFYETMNSANSILQRLIRKLNLIDYVDEEIGTGKLNLIMKLPYIVKTETRKNQVQKRLAEINEQLSDKNNKYGITYTDGTESIRQLNRPIDNKMIESVKQLEEMLFTQLGLDPTILNNTATKDVLQSYRNRILKPILEHICDELTRKFITSTGRSQGQRVKYFYNAFELMPLSDMADIGDKFSRNAILTPNEIRQLIGLPPSSEPIADELSNKNLYNEENPEVVEDVNVNEQEEPLTAKNVLSYVIKEGGENQNA